LQEYLWNDKIKPIAGLALFYVSENKSYYLSVCSIFSDLLKVET